ncbi:hypothetical protein ACFSKM_08780 [Ancylobacter dichloromethanicus]
MKLLVLRDKKPGHFNQAEGVALAVGRLAPTEVARLDIRPTWFAHDDVRKFIMRRYGSDARKWLRSMYAIEAESLEKAGCDHRLGPADHRGGHPPQPGVRRRAVPLFRRHRRL